MTNTTSRFEYIPSYVLQGENEHDFLIYYYEGSQRLQFLGQHPYDNALGYLEFPSESSWVANTPSWAKEEREVIKARLLSYAAESDWLSWLAASNFGKIPRAHPPMRTETEAAQCLAACQAAKTEYETIVKRSSESKRMLGQHIALSLAAGVLAYIALKLFWPWF